MYDKEQTYGTHKDTHVDTLTVQPQEILFTNPPLPQAPFYSPNKLSV